MAQFVIRDFEEEISARLESEACRHGWSVEEEARQILRTALDCMHIPIRLGTRIAARFEGQGIDGALPELHRDIV